MMAQKRAALFFIQSVDNLQLHPHAFLRLDLTLKARHDLGELLPHNLNKLDKFGRFRVCKKKKKKENVVSLCKRQKKEVFSLTRAFPCIDPARAQGKCLNPLGSQFNGIFGNLDIDTRLGN